MEQHTYDSSTLYFATRYLNRVGNIHFLYAFQRKLYYKFKKVLSYYYPEEPLYK